MNLKLEVYDESIRKIIPDDAQLEAVACGFVWTEGPVWCGNYLLFVDLPRNRIVCWTMRQEGPEVTTFRHPCGHTNGMTLDRGRRLIACEAGLRRVTRTELDGSIVVIADRYNGRRLNSPNDVVARSDGSIYFTDPTYGLEATPIRPAYSFGGRELDFSGVYRISPDGQLSVMADDFDHPNGLAFSPDESILYVADTPRLHIRAIDVKQDGSVSNSRVFILMKMEGRGAPDGMKIDQQGNVYSGGPGGLWVINPQGKCIGRILTPEFVANLAWGDADWKSLYIACRDCVYRLRTSVPGIQVPS